MQPSQEQSDYAFLLNGLKVDPVSGLVAGSSGEVRLEPRVMSLLRVLANKPGVLVTRAELLAEIWPGDGVYDEALTQCVYQLRQQLAEAAGNTDSRQLIKTVPKRGYILQAEVQFPSPSKTLPADTNATGSHTGRAMEAAPIKPKRHLVIGTLVGVLVLVAAWMALRAPSHTATSQSGQFIQSIAVLPFLPVVPEQSDPVLEFGMADTLITRLSSLGSVVVRPVNSVRRFAGLDRNSIEAGRMLAVDSVVEGTIQRAGDDLRVTARLLKVADGTALWTGSFDAPLAGVFAMQDEICEQIAASLSLRLQPEAGISGLGGTRNTKAYELYLKGRLHLVQLTRVDLLASRDFFQQAVDLDGNYAQAWLGLASVNFRLPLAGEVPPEDHYIEARDAALKALSIDNSLAEGHAFLGWVSFWYDWDWAASERHFRQAIELNANEFESRLGYAHLLSNTGRHDEALVQIRRAREINPLFPMGAVLEAGFLKFAGMREEALRLLQLAVEQNPGFWLARLNLAEDYLASGELDKALAEIRQARALAPDSSFVLATEVNIFAQNGHAGEANELQQALLEKSRQHYVSPYHLAMAHAGVGDAEGAMTWLQQAVAERNPMLVFLNADPIWDVLRSRADFRAVLQQVHLADLPD